jgi:hypothetical protein
MAIHPLPAVFMRGLLPGGNDNQTVSHIAESLNALTRPWNWLASVDSHGGVKRLHFRQCLVRSAPIRILLV